MELCRRKQQPIPLFALARVELQKRSVFELLLAAALRRRFRHRCVIAEGQRLLLATEFDACQDLAAVIVRVYLVAFGLTDKVDDVVTNTPSILS